MIVDSALSDPGTVAVPGYLLDLYWWAYVHPVAVRVFERQWLVNCILLGNFTRLRDAALRALGRRLPGRTIQLGCVYGNLTPRLASRIEEKGELDVVDVLPIQLENLQAKLPPAAPVNLRLGNSAALELPSASYDRALLFFLLHEQPETVRRATLHEAYRVLKPGGRLVIVDYHRPTALHPLRLLLRPLLRRLEPYALDLWQGDLLQWLPDAARLGYRKRTFFGGLYQCVAVEKLA
jgi:ubiquinone/menaquinone biosynthesis C-methylase UbiE